MASKTTADEVAITIAILENIAAISSARLDAYVSALDVASRDFMRGSISRTQLDAQLAAARVAALGTPS